MVVAQSDFAIAMRQSDALAQLVAQSLRYLCTNDCVIQIFKALALLQLQRLLIAIAHVVEVRGRCSKHGKSTVRISQRQRYHPCDATHGLQCLHTAPADIVSRAAYPKDSVQQQLYRTSACTHNQVGA